MAKFKRKGCGPRGLGASPLKQQVTVYVKPKNVIDQVPAGTIYLDQDGDRAFHNDGFENKNDFHLMHAFDIADSRAPQNKGKAHADMSITEKGPGSFAVPTAKQHRHNTNINKNIDKKITVPYERGTHKDYKNGLPPTFSKQSNKTAQSSKPAQSTKTTTKKSKPSGKIAYGGTKTWAEGSKAAKASTGKSLNQLVAARKGLKKGSAEYNTIQNQINAALGSKVRHNTPAKKKGYRKKRR